MAPSSLHGSLRASSRTSPCPTENAVIEFVQGRGTPGNMRAIEEHLDRCFRCHAVIAEVAGAATRGPVAPRVEEVSAIAQGSRAGRYRLEEMIGAGAMGVVYAAYDDELGRRVAIKVVRPEWSGSSAHRARLHREAWALAKVAHPNVATVYDVGTMDGNVFIAMEYVEGSSLRHWLRGRPRSWREILDVMLGAARGLAAAHAAGIVHRDFKPQNVLVDGDGRAVVVDFGLACPATPPGPSRSGETLRMASISPPDREASGLTASGTLLGTPAYMAPEQREGRTADGRSDQYSFCVVLYEALHGERPFEAGRRSRATTKRSSSPPTWLARALERGLDPKPAGRYPSMSALALALRPRRSVWRWALPALALAAVPAAAGVGWHRHVQRERDAQHACTMAAHSAAEVWSGTAIGRARAGFLGSGLPYAETTWHGVERHLSDYVSGWSTMRLQVCTDALRAGRSELVRRQESCLADRLDELRASTDLLSAPDERTINGAFVAVSSLIPPNRCANVNALPAMLSDPDKEAKLRDVNARTAHVRALVAMGRWGDARGPAEESVRAADALAFAPAQARARLHLGAILRYAGDMEAADTTYLRALSLADAAGNDRTRVEALEGLLGNVPSLVKSHFERVPLYELEARAALQRLGGDELLEAMLESQLALAYIGEGKLDLAQQASEKATKTARQRLQADDPQLRMLLVIHAQIAFRQGRYEDALAIYRDALEVATKAAGPDGPATAEPLGDIALTLTHVGKTSEAVGYADRAVAIAERDFPPDHPFLGMQYDLRSGILEDVGRLEDARQDARRALVIIEKNFGTDDVLAVSSLSTLGNTSVALGDLKGGIATLERASSLCSGPECAKLTRAGVDFELARALRLAGRQPKRALALADEAIALYRELGDPEAEAVRAWRAGR